MLSNIEIFSIQSNLFLHPPTHPPTSTTPPVDLFPQSISSRLYSVFCGFPCPAGSTFFCTIALLDFYTCVLFCVFFLRFPCPAGSTPNYEGTQSLSPLQLCHLPSGKTSQIIKTQGGRRGRVCPCQEESSSVELRLAWNTLLTLL